MSALNSRQRRCWAKGLGLFALLFLATGEASLASDRYCTGRIIGNEEQALDLALAAYKKHPTLAISEQCLVFVAEPLTSSRFYTIDVREKHDQNCGGDPTVSPRILSIKIDRLQGCASYIPEGFPPCARP